MRLLGILFYSSVIMLIGLVLIVFSLNFVQPQEIADVLSLAQGNVSSRWIIGIAGALLIMISFSFAQLILGRFQKEKTIAFQTSSGEVTIALSAVEDLIRRMTGIIPEIKELKPNVIATKKGLLVDLRVILRTETNIPDLIAQLQEQVRAKLQEVLGIEEQIIIKVHVSKISAVESKDKKRKDEDAGTTSVPFRGYSRM